MIQVLISIQSLLSKPNLDDPLDEEINKVWKDDEKNAMKVAK